MNVPKNEITRFPHAVLEVKLQLEDEDQTPPWVTELIKSGTYVIKSTCAIPVHALVCLVFGIFSVELNA